MARKPRIVVPGSPHHVFQRGNNRRRLFSYPRDYLRFLWYLERARAKTRCLIHQLTLMVNHFHLIVTPPEDSLGEFMKAATQPYATYRNGERDGSGKLFEERFHSKVVDSVEYLSTLTAYNDTNAYQAGAVFDSTEHRWSTIGIHFGLATSTDVSRGLWTPSDWYVGLGESPAERANAYREFVFEYLKEPVRPMPESWARKEDEALEPYTRRLERPDGSSAREKKSHYGEKED